MNVEVNKLAKAYAQEKQVIEAHAAKVYSLLGDINNWPEWQKKVKKAVLKDSLEEGKRFIWLSNGMKINSKLHTVVPNREIGWTGRIWWITAVHNWTFIEQDGKCTVTVEESMKGFLSGLMKKSLKEGMKQNLMELKIAAES